MFPVPIFDLTDSPVEERPNSTHPLVDYYEKYHGKGRCTEVTTNMRLIQEKSESLHVISACFNLMDIDTLDEFANALWYSQAEVLKHALRSMRDPAE